jgi:DNA gyrase subunit B
MLENNIGDADAAAALLAQVDSADGHVTELVEQSPEELRVRVTERSTGFARTHRLRRSLFLSGDYQQLIGRYAALTELAGVPPFQLRLRDEPAAADTFDDLRASVLTLSQKGIEVGRFKGLGEMNAEQLWETTMDPGKRLLMRVEVEDASAADRMFSMLMGDQVEPRREFIEQNAKDVKFLDV